MEKLDREAMAKVEGYTSAYGARTWDSIVEDFYQQAAEENVEQSQKSELEHVLMMTGEAEASLDPTLSPSLNRVV
jgi:hypothetical protein